jgi:Phage integrase family
MNQLASGRHPGRRKANAKPKTFPLTRQRRRWPTEKPRTLIPGGRPPNNVGSFNTCGGSVPSSGGAIVVVVVRSRSSRKTWTPPAARSASSTGRVTRRARSRCLDAAEAVDRWLDCRKRLGLTGRHPLFCTLTGEPLWDSYVRTLCKRLPAKAGVEKRVHPHWLQHGWALAQVQSGPSLNAIQQLLGHRRCSGSRRRQRSGGRKQRRTTKC